MRRDCLGVLKCAAIFQVRRDPRAPERMTAGALWQTCLFRPPLDHGPDIIAVHRPLSELAMPVQAAKERPFLIPPQASGFEVHIHIFLGVVMRGHLVALAALLVEPEPPALAVLVVVL